MVKYCLDIPHNNIVVKMLLHTPLTFEFLMYVRREQKHVRGLSNVKRKFQEHISQKYIY